MVILVNGDGQVSVLEISEIREMGMRMGLNELAVNQVLTEIQKAENGMLSTDRLVQILKVYQI
ncbi:MAG: hypothetical protein ACI84C_000384 [Flavobacteriales bacterium]|jgi:hypothetical protein